MGLSTARTIRSVRRAFGQESIVNRMVRFIVTSLSENRSPRPRGVELSQSCPRGRLVSLPWEGTYVEGSD